MFPLHSSPASPFSGPTLSSSVKPYAQSFSTGIPMFTSQAESVSILRIWELYLLVPCESLIQWRSNEQG